MKRSEDGFTVIELLVAMAILGTVAAIAIPHFAGYMDGGFDSRAQVILKNAVIAEEALFTDNGSYVACDQSNCEQLLPGLGPVSSGVQLEIELTAQGILARAYHPKGSGAVFTWSH